MNPADGSVWVVDVELNAKKEEVIRIQKFSQAGALLASRAIEPNEAVFGKAEANRFAEGIAFDPTNERAYVLVTEESEKTIKEDPVASELFAFSTKTTGSTIEPAVGTKAGGVLVPRTETKLTGSQVGKSEFGPNSSEKGAVLIEPGGIAVNPTNHQVLITGWIGEERPVVWAISETGEIKAIWEDEKGFFNKCGCLSSPVVTAAGKILVLGDEAEEINELPSDLKSSTLPTRAFWLPRSGECESKINNKEEPCPFVEKLTRIEDGSSIEGGEMSLGPEGDLYVHIRVKTVAEGGLEDGAVMVLNPSFEEIGWIGGGSWGSATKACAVNETDPGNLGVAAIAGYKEKAFMLERGDPIAGEHAKLLELGPGGDPANCPRGSASELKAEAGGLPLGSFPIADTVTLSSKLIQANAISTEWEFEPGVTQLVSKRQQETTLVEHQFVNGGVINVVANINTDDLASPLVTAKGKVTIVAPELTESVTPESTSVTLKGEVNPLGSPTKCEFQVALAGEPFTGAGVKKAACPTNPGEGTKPVAESVKLSGLTSGTEYHSRLLGQSGQMGKQDGTEMENARCGRARRGNERGQ